MKISKILTLFLSVGLLLTTAASCQTIPGFGMIHEVWIKPDAVKHDLTQADFITSSVISTVAANMISNDNSLAKVTFGAAVSLLASAHAVNHFEKTAPSTLSKMLAGPIGTCGFNINHAKINKIVACLIYLAGQNSMQIGDFVWNSKSYISEIFNFFSKSRDGKEMIAIALRNLAPLALLSENGSNGYKFLQRHLKPQLSAV